MKRVLTAALLVAAASAAPGASAHGLKAATDADKIPAFDITSAQAETDGRLTTFMMEVAGVAGAVEPAAIGQLAGSKVGAALVIHTNPDDYSTQPIGGAGARIACAAFTPRR